MRVADRFYNINGVAIHGIDPVGYFRQSQPILGDAQFASQFLGFTFWHIDAENRDIFLSNTNKYAPQFGGYCAMAMSEGAVATSIPEAWNIVNSPNADPQFAIHGDLLYLNYSLYVRNAWRRDTDNNILRARRHWPHILETYGPPR